jgi:hypothetical protein
MACGGDTTIKVVNEDPAVVFLRPQNGTGFDPINPVSICLQITDEDVLENLTITVESDIDGILAASAADLTPCDGGNAGLEVLLSDTLHTLTATAIDTWGQTATQSVSIEPTEDVPPTCSWISPENDALIDQNTVISFEAHVDDENQDPSTLLVNVDSDLDDSLWSGAPSSEGNVVFSTTDLTPGSHSIQLSVQDSRGHLTLCPLTLEINPCLDDDLDGWTTCDGDCDDDDGTVWPGAEEVVDGKDNDCDGIADEGTDLYDDDGDGWTEFGGDCDDTDSSIHPGATEIYYDGVDQNCDGKSDYDKDEDGHDSDAYSGTDCDDDDRTLNPDAIESYYDGIDQNCDGKSDYDKDGDGYDSNAYSGTDCNDSVYTINPGATEIWYDGTDQNCDGKSDYDKDGDGYDSDAYTGNDCNDSVSAINPGATEIYYDGIDQNCDGKNDYDQDEDGYLADTHGGSDCDDLSKGISPGAIETYYDGIDQNCDGKSDYDKDEDGYDSDAYSGTDCDDEDRTLNPGAIESYYDGIDQNCDGKSDYDKDEDGYDSNAYSGTDCNDSVYTINPGAPEIWYDGTDQNCDGKSDYDKDGDGYLYDVYGGSDCNDSDTAISPVATEVWYDGVDQNCDGRSDYDQDGDGFDSDAYSGTDCDDTNYNINPTATEGWYDGIDQDCDGESDYDQDKDGEDSDLHGGTDCDDLLDTVNSLSTEVRDGLDNDCDNYCDEGLLAAGDLVITEFLKDPDAVSDTYGEWLEIYNTTGTDITLCQGWTLEDDDTDSANIVSEVLIPAGEYTVFVKNEDMTLNGGVLADYEHGTGYILANGADEIVLLFNDPVDGLFEMSRVDYLDGPGWPDARGKSISLDPDFYSETDNDDVTNWCHGTSTFGDGDVGTPGADNDEC